MNKDIKAYVDNRDIINLRYVFSQALNVDPTFDSYNEEYNYCVANNVFEKHVDGEFTLIVADSGKWDKAYWNKLCLDLEKNLSKERLDHMVKVAKTVYADKIKRLSAERIKEVNVTKTDNLNIFDETKSKTDVQMHNEKMRELQRFQNEKIERRKKELADENTLLSLEDSKVAIRNSSSYNAGDRSKKVVGESIRQKKHSHGISVVLVAIGIVVLLLIAYLLNK